MGSEPKPPRSAEAVRGLDAPSSVDRRRVRDRIERALASGEVSDTVRRVDRAMREGAPVVYGAGWRGAASLAKLLVPTLFIGIGLGAFVGRQTAPSATAAGHAPAAPPSRASAGETGAPRVEPPALADADESRPPAPALKDTQAAGPAAPRRSHLTQRARLSGATQPAHEVASIVDSPLPPQASVPPPPQPAAASHLSEELHLMRVASSAVHAADWVRADRALAEHARRFPNGALSQERRALELLAACEQGSRPDRRELAAFLREPARSTLAPRVREACADRR